MRCSSSGSIDFEYTPAEKLGRDPWAVDGQDDARVVSGGAQPGDDAVRGSALLDAVVEHAEREVECVRLLADGKHLVAHLGEQPEGTLGEHLATKPSKRLGRAEARRRSAEQDDPGDR
jgi:hypothetical protein